VEGFSSLLSTNCALGREVSECSSACVCVARRVGARACTAHLRHTGVRCAVVPPGRMLGDFLPIPDAENLPFAYA
jgi:hypothetical protein